MYIRDIIDKKRNKKELTEEEVRFFIFGYHKEEISEAQASAMLTAIHIYGLSENEMVYMIKAVAETGEELEFYRVSNKITDINSLGGISDKNILILMSIIHALGFPVAKVIGRELGMEDRLISIQGYNLEEDIEQFKQTLNKENLGILKSIKNLAPIENRLYKLRHDIACDNNMQLIAISIMSQKIALGFTNIFFEITYGENAYVKNFADAKILAKYLVSIGKKLMRNVSCCITKLNEPSGTSFGNLIEMKEIYDSLNGKMPKDMRELILDFGSSILMATKVSNSFYTSKKMIEEVIDNGKALEAFELLIKNQNGNIDILKNDIEVNKVIPVTSTESGSIQEIDINKLRMLSRYINSIRADESDKLDIGAGVVFNKKVGDVIDAGGILAYIYTNNDTKIESAVSKLKDIFVISKAKVKIGRKVEFSI